MTRRSRIVTAQAAIVGLLVVIVFVTLLRPEGGGTLFRIEAPGGPERAGLPAPGSYTGGDDESGGEPGGGRETRPGTIRAGENAGGTLSAGATSVLEQSVSGAPTGVGDDGGGAGSPTDDQYADTLSRLAARLN